mgnify:CR=1 FL=1
MKKTQHFHYCNAPLCAEMDEKREDIVVYQGESKCSLLYKKHPQKRARNKAQTSLQKGGVVG